MTLTVAYNSGMDCVIRLLLNAIDLPPGNWAS